METASETLLILVSSILTIFLIVLIIAIVYIIKVLKIINRITEHAENVAESVEAAANTFERAASPLAILKIVGNIVDQASRIRKRKD